MHGRDATDRLEPEQGPTNEITTIVGLGFEAVVERADSFFPGELVAGRFHIVRLLGRGGSGEVYEARDGVLGQAVAAKVLAPSAEGRLPDLEWLRQELLLARRITHPEICRLHDVVEHRSGVGNGTLVLTMELLEGPTLAAWLEGNGPVSLAESLPWIRRLAEGVDAAHEAGVLHLDLKPGNVILVSRGSAGKGDGIAAGGGLEFRPVITDFGLSRLLAAGTKRRSGGTPGYMAPEQIRGGELSPATDLYGLAATIHKMLTGETPDAPAEGVLGRALADDPEHRPADAATLVAELEKEVGAAGERRPHRPHRPRRPHRHPLLLGMTILLAVAGLAVASWLVSEVPRSPPSDTVPPENVPAPVDAAIRGAVEDLRSFDAASAVRRLAQMGTSGTGVASFHAVFSDALWLLGREQDSRRHAESAVAAASHLPRRERLIHEARLAARRFDWRRAARLYDSVWSPEPRRFEVGLALFDAHRRIAENERAAMVFEELRARFARPQDARWALVEAEGAQFLGDAAAAADWARRARGIADASGDEPLAAEARRVLGSLLLGLGRAEEARLELQQARQIFARHGQPSLAASCERILAEVHDTELEDAAARSLYERSIGTQRRVGSQRRLAVVLHSSAAFELQRGVLDVADERLAEAFNLFVEIGDLQELAAVTTDLGLLAMNRGHLDAAVAHFERALELDRRLGRKRGEIYVLNNLAEIYYGSGQERRAAESWSRARRLAQDIGDDIGVQLASVNLAELAWKRGHAEESERILEPVLAAEGVHRMIRAHAWYVAAKGAWLRGDLGRAEEHYRRSLELTAAPGSVSHRALYRGERAIVLALDGRRDDAAEQALVAWHEVASSQMPFHVEQVAASAVETLLRAGRPDQARRILDTYRAEAPRTEPPVGGVRISLAEARLLFAEARPGTARGLLRPELERTAVDRSRRWEIEAFRLLVRIDQALNDPAAAREWQRRAAMIRGTEGGRRE